MGDGLEERIAAEDKAKRIAADIYSGFGEYARRFAGALGASLGNPILDDYSEAPLLAQNSAEAVARANSLCHTVALTSFPKLDFVNYERGQLRGCVGYDSAGKPVVCLLRGVMRVFEGNETLGFMSAVVAYELRATVPEAAHRPLDS